MAKELSCDDRRLFAGALNACDLTMNRLLAINPAIGPHYDKLLHASITFLLVLFLHKCLPVYLCIAVVSVLQISKSLLNLYSGYIEAKKPGFWGDWMANLAGYVLVVLYLVI